MVQKFKTADDAYIGSIDVGSGSWNSMVISPDSKYAYLTDWSEDGRIAYVDLETLSFIQYYEGTNLFSFPYNITANTDFTTLYVTTGYGNSIYKIDVSNPYDPHIDQIVLAPGQQPSSIPGTFDPVEVDFSSDQSKYFVTCYSSYEVRVFNVLNDSLLNVIKVSAYPTEMTLSQSHPYLFVTNAPDPCHEAECKSSLNVINYSDLSFIKVFTSGLFQPHGTAIDDSNGYLLVANRNLTTDGPAPHHHSECGGRNGFLLALDLNTLGIYRRL